MEIFKIVYSVIFISIPRIATPLTGKSREIKKILMVRESSRFCKLLCQGIFKQVSCQPVQSINFFGAAITRIESLSVFYLLHQENMSVKCAPPQTPLLYSKTGVCRGIPIFSSPEPSGSQGELIVYPCSVVRPSSVVHHFQRSSSLKQLGQSKPNFT